MSVRRIAQLAGVSACTVSLALHHSEKIPAATRQRVLRIARRLGYQPDTELAQLMTHMRLKRDPQRAATLGVMSFYDTPHPWEGARHLQRLYDGMNARADALGYRLEPLWLKAPKMTPARFCRELDARGIKGLLCFGSPNLDEEMPPEFDRYAIVTQGVSIKTPLHRVGSHAYNDMWRALKKVHELGYRRPGLVIGDYEGARSAHAYLCVYLGWSHLTFGTEPAIPVLHLKEVEEAPFVAWLNRHAPDVLIFAHHYRALPELARVLRRHRLRPPADLGIAVVTQVIEGTRFSGLQGNQRAVGASAVELLVGRIHNRDFGLPAHPRTDMVEMEWIDGQTLRPRPA